MADDCVKFVDRDVSKPTIQVMPKATAANSATPAKPSQSSSSLSSLNSAAFNDATTASASSGAGAGNHNNHQQAIGIGSLPSEANCDNLFAKTSNVNPLQNINNSNSTSTPPATTAANLQYPPMANRSISVNGNW